MQFTDMLNPNSFFPPCCTTTTTTTATATATATATDTATAFKSSNLCRISSGEICRFGLLRKSFEFEDPLENGCRAPCQGAYAIAVALNS